MPLQFEECIGEGMTETRQSPIERPVEWLLLYISHRDDEIHNRDSGNRMKGSG